MRWPRMTTRALMILVTLSALLLWPIGHLVRKPHYEQLASLHKALAAFCEEEAALMGHRAEACAAKAQRGADWDEKGEVAEDLRYGPYGNDPPRYGSWAEQAATWDRAADRARAAADWHDSMYRYYIRSWPGPMPARPR